VAWFFGLGTPSTFAMVDKAWFLSLFLAYSRCDVEHPSPAGITILTTMRMF
jgi:hypothetical protein